jgi:hypothetical protein
MCESLSAMAATAHKTEEDVQEFFDTDDVLEEKTTRVGAGTGRVCSVRNVARNATEHLRRLGGLTCAACRVDPRESALHRLHRCRHIDVCWNS